MAANIPVGPQAFAVQNIAGRITASAQARSAPPVHNLSGRIGGGSRLALATFRPIQYLSGRIAGQTKTALRTFVGTPQNLSGQISGVAQARLRAAQAFLAGRISAGAKGTVKVNWFAGRVKTAGTAQLGNLGLRLAARVSARAKTQLRIADQWVLGQLSVWITARSRAQAQPPLLWQNPGQLTLRVSGRTQIRLRPANLWVSGQLSTTITARSQIRVPAATLAAVTQLALPPTRISATSAARLGPPDIIPHPLTLSGAITAISEAVLAGTYASRFSGQITARTNILGASQPRQNILAGTITAAAVASLIISEIIAPLPPYPPPFPTLTIGDYLDHVTSEHNQKPKYMTTVGMSVEPMIDDQQLVAGLIGLFDLDYSVGQQEDFTGQWIGKSRWIELPGIFFTWDQEGEGWNQAPWKGPVDAANKLERLDDYHYRLLLYATIIANHWDGSIPKAYEAWDTLFQYAGLKVIIQDYGNMTMLYGILSDQILDTVLLSLFLTGQMDLKPEGVQLRAYALQPEPGVPFFAWDSSSDSVLGWDSGYWGRMVPPGQAYIPTTEGSDDG